MREGARRRWETCAVCRAGSEDGGRRVRGAGRDRGSGTEGKCQEKGSGERGSVRVNRFEHRRRQFVSVLHKWDSANNSSG